MGLVRWKGRWREMDEWRYRKMAGEVRGMNSGKCQSISELRLRSRVMDRWVPEMPLWCQPNDLFGETK